MNEEHTKIVGGTSNNMENMTRVENEPSTKANYFQISCVFSIEQFNTVSNLEKHIRSLHVEGPKFKCDHCCKTLLTKWRLVKHTRMHYTKNLKRCKYYMSGIFCPFNELGCKFEHEKVRYIGTETSEDEHNEEKEMEDINVEQVEDIHVEYFKDTFVDSKYGYTADIFKYTKSGTLNSEDRMTFTASTPKKLGPLENLSFLLGH